MRYDNYAVGIAVGRPTGDEGQAFVGGGADGLGVSGPLGGAGILFRYNVYGSNRVGNGCAFVGPNGNLVAGLETVQVTEDRAADVIVATDDGIAQLPRHNTIEMPPGCLTDHVPDADLFIPFGYLAPT